MLMDTLQKVVFLLVTLLLIVAVIYISEAQRKLKFNTLEEYV